MTENQINILKFLIIRSRDSGPLAKKVALLLIDESRGFTREVRITITSSPRAWSVKDVMEVGGGLHDMRSSNRTTHLHEIMTGMEAELQFSSHIGRLVDGEMRQYPNERSHTVWLAEFGYSRTAAPLTVSRKRLNAISLTEPDIKYRPIYPTR